MLPLYEPEEKPVINSMIHFRIPNNDDGEMRMFVDYVHEMDKAISMETSHICKLACSGVGIGAGSAPPPPTTTYSFTCSV